MEDLNAFFANEQAKLDERNKTASDDQKRILKQLDERQEDDAQDKQDDIDLPLGPDLPPAQQVNSGVQEEAKEEVKVARPTTNPTHNSKRLAKENSYTYWKEGDAKRAGFEQNYNPDAIKPKKIEDPELLKKIQKADGVEELVKTNSAWNKAKTWENKNLKLDHVKKYLISQKITMGSDNQKGMLIVDGVKEITGDCSIAVVRGKPRIGHTLTMTVQLKGIDGTFLEGVKVEIYMDELCDDSCEPESTQFEIKGMNDTCQSGTVKDVVGHSNNCDKLCKQIWTVLREYPDRCTI